MIVAKAKTELFSQFREVFKLYGNSSAKYHRVQLRNALNSSSSFVRKISYITLAKQAFVLYVGLLQTSTKFLKTVSEFVSKETPELFNLALRFVVTSKEKTDRSTLKEVVTSDKVKATLSPRLLPIPTPADAGSLG